LMLEFVLTDSLIFIAPVMHRLGLMIV